MFYKLTVDSWAKINLLENKLREGGRSSWIFRGQTDESWPLSTNFEREAANYERLNNTHFFKNRERYVLQDFQRRAYNYTSNLPEQENYIEWLSMLQHYGGPTRLLDFTYSFYVALFFCMEKAIIKKACCNSDKEKNAYDPNSAIWAIDINKLKHQLSELPAYKSIEIEDQYDKFCEKYRKWAKDIFVDNKSEDVVFFIDPYRQNERIAAQQGVFLFPGNIEKPFEFNMCKLLKLDFEELSDENAKTIELSEVKEGKYPDMSIVKIILPVKLRYEILFKLYNMNITSAALFPGLDGFARSLSFRFAELDLALKQYE